MHNILEWFGLEDLEVSLLHLDLQPFLRLTHLQQAFLPHSLGGWPVGQPPPSGAWRGMPAYTTSRRLFIGTSS